MWLWRSWSSAFALLLHLLFKEFVRLGERLRAVGELPVRAPKLKLSHSQRSDNQGGHDDQRGENQVTLYASINGVAVDLVIDRSDPLAGHLDWRCDTHRLRTGRADGLLRRSDLLPAASEARDPLTVMIVDADPANLIERSVVIDRLLGSHRVFEVQRRRSRFCENLGLGQHRLFAIALIGRLALKMIPMPTIRMSKAKAKIVSGIVRQLRDGAADLGLHCCTPTASASNRELISRPRRCAAP